MNILMLAWFFLKNEVPESRSLLGTSVLLQTWLLGKVLSYVMEIYDVLNPNNLVFCGRPKEKPRPRKG